MNKILALSLLACCLAGPVAAMADRFAAQHQSQNFTQDYETMVTFPAGFVVGDYIEFVGVAPLSAGASGYFEVSISYTRGYIAAAATHIAAIPHAGPAVWREAGRINNNAYVGSGVNFTIDCNTEYVNPRFRIRAVNNIGVPEQNLPVYIRVRAINFNNAFTALSQAGNDLSVNKFLPMSLDWSLYVGNGTDAAGASLAIKANGNGNIGIGTDTPQEKLSVNGKIRAQEIKVETSNWPDYVFAPDYEIEPLTVLRSYIKENRHLPDIPSADEVQHNGVQLGEMNRLLLKKIEEITLYLLELDKKVNNLEVENKDLKNLINK